MFALITEISVNDPSCPPFLNELFHVLLLSFALLFFYEFYRYILYLIIPKNQIRLPSIVAFSLCCAAILVLIFTKIDYLDSNGIKYSSGIGVFVCYGMACVIFLVSVLLLAVNFNKLKHSIVYAILPLTVLAFLGMIIQVYIPTFLFTGSDLTLILLGAFFAIENPVGRFEDRAYIDIDTHAQNRTSYERDFMALKKRAADGKIEFPFTYVICDLNGLKDVNDSFGHIEGDKLITTAAEILMSQLKSAKGVYRIGGDEFAVFYEGVKNSVVEDEIKSVDAECEQASKTLVTPLTISIGSAMYNEGSDIEDLIRQADENMYENKARFYQKKGINKRRSQDCSAVFRDTTTKMLKLNLADDSYMILKVELREKKEEEGYSEKLSEWVKGFIKAGYVHEDSLELFKEKFDLKKIQADFMRSKKPVSFVYKRRHGMDYYQTYVEIVPVKDYNENNQIAFLYVKNLNIR
ncbi:GGDEF domain-containing protein [Treponema sp.]|uniref:GGDEF domain-containing protein n=1 Tax=Treponema sp. TaxID=166 RepID=UPI00298E2DDC|nr:GGDEF domain-containing protein [Treponema sp.]MCR5612646.1 GGDEF domain-containing protein [Treponema sp.]